MTITEIGKMTDTEARKYLEQIRWPNGPVSPHCQSTNVTRMQGESHRAGTIQCNNPECREQFTVTVGSVMESTKIPLVKWAMGFHMMCSSKKGISALQLQRNLGFGSCKTASFMCHRIRLAMTPAVPQTLSGIVEAVNLTVTGGGPSEFSGSFSPGAVGCALTLLAGGLWWNAPALGRRMTPEHLDDLGSTALTAEAVLSVAFASIGLYIVATSLKTFVQIATLVSFARYTFGNLWRDDEWRLAIIQDGLMIVIGLWLMFGNRGLIRLVKWARSADKESPVAVSGASPSSDVTQREEK